MAIGSEKNYTIGIDAKDKTKRGLTSAQRNLRRTSKEADTLAGRFRSVARATMVLEGPLGGTAGRLSGIATLLGSVNASFVATGASITALTAVAYQSLKAFAEFEQQTFGINQLLEQTGNAAGLTGQQIEDMAQSIGAATLESTEGVRDAATTLLTFKSVAGDAFGRTLEVAADLAATTNVDLRGAIIQLGKALEDPATGMSALRRSGVSFTNAQKEMIVQMKETGRVAEAQAEILSILEGQLGGAARAKGEGLAGAVDLVAERWGRFMESLAASGAGKAATDTMNALAGAIKSVNDALVPDDETRFWQLNDQIEKLTEQSIKNANRQGRNSNKVINQRLAALKEEANEIFARFEEEQKLRDQARIDSQKAQQNIIAEEKAEKALTEQKKRTAEAMKEANQEKEKDKSASQAYINNLQKENEAFQNSLLTKAQQEDMALEMRLERLQADRDNKLISDEELHAAEQAAYQIHNAKMTEINQQELDKRSKSYERMKQREFAVTRAALGEISSLMSSETRALFNIGKAAAIADATMRSYQAYTTTLAHGGYFAKPLAIAALVSGLAQVAKIASTKMSAARQTGGVVLGGRTYLVGERGPELFTAPVSGSIINNNETRNIGGNTNVINVTVMNETDEQFITKQQNNIWNSIIDRMNEEGLRFA